MARNAMVSAAVLTLLALSLVPVRSQAAPGLSLAWDHCLSQGTGVQNKVFACDTNVGAHKLVGTFQLGSNLADVTGNEIHLQLASAGAALPPWWTYVSAGSCRQTEMLANGVPDPGDAACADWSGGQMSTFLATYCTSTGTCVDRPSAANQARIKVIGAVMQQDAAALVAGQDYFSFNLVILNSKTVGAGSCVGCESPACIVLNSIRLSTLGNLANRLITGASVPGGDFVTWQGGGGTNCPAATPTRSSTWGSVKSLYR